MIESNFSFSKGFLVEFEGVTFSSIFLAGKICFFFFFQYEKTLIRNHLQGKENKASS